MEMKKYISLFSLGLILLISGCSKKGEKSCSIASNDENMEQITQVAKNDPDYEIPVVQEEVEDFFDEDNISEFAFVDDENEEIKEELDDTTFVEDVQQDIVAQNEDKDVFSQDLADEDTTVAWQEDDNEQDVVFSTVYFDINKNNIKDSQKTALNENIEKAKAIVDEGKNIVIQGHTCQLGADSYNLPLSEKRANAIKREMVKNGIPEDKIKIIGCGKEMPVVWSDNPNKAERVKELAANRRSEILVG